MIDCGSGGELKREGGKAKCFKLVTTLQRRNKVNEGRDGRQALGRNNNVWERCWWDPGSIGYGGTG